MVRRTVRDGCEAREVVAPAAGWPEISLGRDWHGMQRAIGLSGYQACCLCSCCRRDSLGCLDVTVDDEPSSDDPSGAGRRRSTRDAVRVTAAALLLWRPSAPCTTPSFGDILCAADV